MISIIVAAAKNNAIGKNNQLLWHMPADMKFFRKTTVGHPIIMGRKTFESMDAALPKRRNIVITRQADYQADRIEVSPSLEEGINRCQNDADEIFIIGGAQIYQQAMPLADKLYLTRIHGDFEDADAFFPEVKDDEWTLESIEHHESDQKNPYDYSFCIYIKTISS